MVALEKFKLSIAAVVLVFFGSTSVNAASPMRCEIDTKQSCVAVAGCTQMKPSVFNVIDLNKKTYSRCDAAGCDTYDAEVNESGAFTNITIPGRGVVAKLNGENGSFVEIVSLGLQVLVSFGQCR